MTLAMDLYDVFQFPMFYSVMYPNDIIANSILPGTSGLSYPKELKNKIIRIKDNKLQSTGEFYEWLRGFTDGEGYFAISHNSIKCLLKSGKIVKYESVIFSFVLHLSIRDKDVLYTIQKQLGGIGKIFIPEKGSHAFLRVSARNDVDLLLKLMSDYFSKLNTTKVLDYVAWNQARNLYFGYLDKRDKDSLPHHSDPHFNTILQKVISIKNSMNKSRVDFKLPENHKITITKRWLLGFFEGEGCFVVKSNSVFFSLVQTRVNRNVLVEIQNFLLQVDNMATVKVYDRQPNKLKQKPYSILYVGETNNSAYLLLILFIDLPWLSIKLWDFIDWAIVYILVAEGKHHTSEGKVTINILKSRMNIKRQNNDVEISNNMLDLLHSASNYAYSEQTGILNIKETLQGRSSKKHLLNSYVLVTDSNNSTSFCFRSNSYCADYFQVNKVSVARWIKKNSPVSIKKGKFLFHKVQR